MSPRRQVSLLTSQAEKQILSQVKQFGRKHHSERSCCVDQPTTSHLCEQVKAVRNYLHVPEKIYRKWFTRVHSERPENVEDIIPWCTVLQVIKPQQIAEEFSLLWKADLQFVSHCSDQVTKLIVDGNLFDRPDGEAEYQNTFVSLQDLFENLPGLKHIEILRLDPQGEILRVISQHCKHLRVLEITHGGAAQHYEMLYSLCYTEPYEHLVKTSLCESLEELSGLWANQMPFNYVELLLTCFHRLKVLDVPFAKHHLFAVVQRKELNVSSLQKLEVNDFDSETVGLLTRHCPQINTLNLVLGSGGFNELTFLSNLTELNVFFSILYEPLLMAYIQDSGHKLLSLFVDMFFDDLETSRDVFDLSSISRNCPNLRKFFWRFEEEETVLTCTDVFVFQHMDTFQLSFVMNLVEESALQNVLLTTSLAKCIKLNSSGSLTDEGLDYVISTSGFPNLTEVGFGTCPLLTLESARNLVFKCPELTVIENVKALVEDNYVDHFQKQLTALNYDVHLEEMSEKMLWFLSFSTNPIAGMSQDTFSAFIDNTLSRIPSTSE